MERTKYPLSHEWHVAVNRHQDAQRPAQGRAPELPQLRAAGSMNQVRLERGASDD